MLSSTIELIDLGTVKEGEIINNSFLVKNEYSSPVTIIKVRSSCGCTVPWIKESMEVKANDTLQVNFTFNTKNRMGSTSKKIFVEYKLDNGQDLTFSQTFKCNIIKNDATH
jgi:hypothetical protein